MKITFLRKNWKFIIDTSPLQLSHSALEAKLFWHLKSIRFILQLEDILADLAFMIHGVQSLLKSVNFHPNMIIYPFTSVHLPPSWAAFLNAHCQKQESGLESKVWWNKSPQRRKSKYLQLVSYILLQFHQLSQLALTWKCPCNSTL